MTTTPASFTVIVNHNGLYYDVEVTPLFNGAPIQEIGDRLSQWNEAERTANVFSKALRNVLTQSNISNDHLIAGVLTVGQGRGITYDTTQMNSEETKKACDAFIKYLQDPEAGIEELGGLDDVASAHGLGATLRVTPNAYLNLKPEEQKKTRLSLFKKKCEEYYGFNGITYTSLELSCRTYLLKQRERSSRANSSQAVNEKKQLEREIMQWFFHKYLLVKEESAELSASEMQEIEEERKALTTIHREVKTAAGVETERRALENLGELENPLDELDV